MICANPPVIALIKSLETMISTFSSFFVSRIVGADLCKTCWILMFLFGTFETFISIVGIGILYTCQSRYLDPSQILIFGILSNRFHVGLLNKLSNLPL